MCTDLLRLLNDRADQAAVACQTRRRLGSTRAAWIGQRQTAEDWELRALMASSAAAAHYHTFLRQLGARPRERPAAAPGLLPSHPASLWLLLALLLCFGFWASPKVP